MKKEIKFSGMWTQITIDFSDKNEKDQYKTDHKIKDGDIELETDTMLIVSIKRSNEFIRIGEASEFLGLKPAYIRNLVSLGEIPYCKQGKFLIFRPIELKSWLEKRTEKR